MSGPAGTSAEGRTGVGDERRARAVWSALVEPGDAVAGALVQACGAAPALAWVAGAVEAGRPDWSQLETAGSGLDGALRGRLGAAVRRWSARWPSLDAERDVAAGRRCGHGW
ncbi:hypothetical protein ACFS33_19590 [Cellulomonas phragmiteti]|uniref:hypothetical protein n=1 Tax=Cellulomonas phragmiteti TaxID=478780 RepID=UPI003640837F